MEVVFQSERTRDAEAAQSTAEPCCRLLPHGSWSVRRFSVRKLSSHHKRNYKTGASVIDPGGTIILLRDVQPYSELNLLKKRNTLC